MALSPFHALYKTRELSSYVYGRDKLLSVFASSDIEVYPYQIAAARFALRSPYLNGVILCDEDSLGKTYEAMLVVAQLWYEGKERILLVAPTPLLGQWRDILENSFSLPFVVLDNNTAFEEQLAEGNEIRSCGTASFLPPTTLRRKRRSTFRKCAGIWPCSRKPTTCGVSTPAGTKTPPSSARR